MKTDHQNLEFLLDQKVGTPMHATRWVSKLLGYDFLEEYKQGKDKKVADALSRCLEEKEMNEITLTMVYVHTLELLEELKLLYLLNPTLQALLKRWKEGTLGPHYSLRKGLLYYKHRLYVAQDKPFKIKLLNLFHSSPMGGHSGFEKTLHRFIREFYWPSLRSKVKEFIHSCDTCQCVKTENPFLGVTIAPFHPF